ncbi:uncharacterized protein EI97DRAFT_435477 [Westerdykella ornata]|uniref:Uncharacterized protein n=1 Tax=Westerdykella ornata TaxID=318751 RepID=A0A6A6JCW9_WESOR|nr:uncharacterized protein EI97DRAFT_435477 [Westerdykella ornata]KAF2274115.1 hypothetical protein EI97DRAFT_435477 [Westerdykella ornata]
MYLDRSCPNEQREGTQQVHARDDVELAQSFTSPLHLSSSPLLFTSPLHLSSSPLLFTSPLHLSSSPFISFLFSVFFTFTFPFI